MDELNILESILKGVEDKKSPLYTKLWFKVAVAFF